MYIQHSKCKLYFLLHGELHFLGVLMDSSYFRVTKNCFVPFVEIVQYFGAQLGMWKYFMLY